MDGVFCYCKHLLMKVFVRNAYNRILVSVCHAHRLCDTTQ